MSDRYINSMEKKSYVASHHHPSRIHQSSSIPHSPSSATSSLGLSRLLHQALHDDFDRLFHDAQLQLDSLDPSSSHSQFLNQSPPLPPPPPSVTYHRHLSHSITHPVSKPRRQKLTKTSTFHHPSSAIYQLTRDQQAAALVTVRQQIRVMEQSFAKPTVSSLQRSKKGNDNGYHPTQTVNQPLSQPLSHYLSQALNQSLSQHHTKRHSASPPLNHNDLRTTQSISQSISNDLIRGILLDEIIATKVPQVLSPHPATPFVSATHHSHPHRLQQQQPILNRILLLKYFRDWILITAQHRSNKAAKLVIALDAVRRRKTCEAIENQMTVMLTTLKKKQKNDSRQKFLKFYIKKWRHIIKMDNYSLRRAQYKTSKSYYKNKLLKCTIESWQLLNRYDICISVLKHQRLRHHFLVFQEVAALSVEQRQRLYGELISRQTQRLYHKYFNYWKLFCNYKTLINEFILKLQRHRQSSLVASWRCLHALRKQLKIAAQHYQSYTLKFYINYFWIYYSNRKQNNKKNKEIAMSHYCSVRCCQSVHIWHRFLLDIHKRNDKLKLLYIKVCCTLKKIHFYYLLQYKNQQKLKKNKMYKAGCTFSNQILNKGFYLWKNYIISIKFEKELLMMAVRRWQALALTATVVVWRRHANHIRHLYQCMQRFIHQKLYGCLSSWRSYAVLRQQAVGVMRLSIQRWKNKLQFYGWMTWQWYASQRQHQRALLRQCLERFTNQHLSKALRQWRIISHQLKSTTHSMRSVINHWQQRHIAAAVRSWLLYARSRRTSLNTMHQCIHYWKNLLLKRSYLRWRDVYTHLCEDRSTMYRVVSHWSQRHLSQALNHWLAGYRRCQTSRRHSSSHAQQRCFTVWMRVYRNILSRKYINTIVRKRGYIILISHALYKWKQYGYHCHRSIEFANTKYSLLCHRALHEVMKTWKQWCKKHGLKTALSTLSVIHYNNTICKKIISRWYKITSYYSNECLRTGWMFYAVRHVSGAISKWRGYCQRQKLKQQGMLMRLLTSQHGVQRGRDLVIQRSLEQLNSPSNESEIYLNFNTASPHASDLLKKTSVLKHRSPSLPLLKPLTESIGSIDRSAFELSTLASQSERWRHELDDAMSSFLSVSSDGETHEDTVVKSFGGLFLSPSPSPSPVSRKPISAYIPTPYPKSVLSSSMSTISSPSNDDLMSSHLSLSLNDLQFKTPLRPCDTSIATPASWLASVISKTPSSSWFNDDDDDDVNDKLTPLKKSCLYSCAAGSTPFPRQTRRRVEERDTPQRVMALSGGTRRLLSELDDLVKSTHG